MRPERSPRQATAVRLSARVDYAGSGYPSERIWFDVPEGMADEASRSGDPWLISLLPLAVTLHEPIQMDPPVDPTLLSNASSLMDIWASWYPELAPVPIEAAPAAQTESEGAHLTGLFFSGGVDSLYSLLHVESTGDLHVDDLILIHGFDIPISNQEAFARAADRAHYVASSTGKRLVTIATNLRETRFQDASWGDLAFGAALAGAGLSLENRYRRLLISSGLPAEILRPHGSHPETDPLLSANSTHVIHYGAKTDRIPKLTFLRDFPLALETMRVCSESDDGGNCGHCRKCMAAMTTLEILGALEEATAFPHRKLDLGDLRRTFLREARITFRQIQEFALQEGREDIAEAIEDAFQRSDRIIRWLGLRWVGQARGRFQHSAAARRLTRWLRPWLWKFGNSLNRMRS